MLYLCIQITLRFLPSLEFSLTFVPWNPEFPEAPVESLPQPPLQKLVAMLKRFKTHFSKGTTKEIISVFWNEVTISGVL